MYKIRKYNGINFYYKLDQTINGYEPHITIRHNISIEEAIFVYFNQDEVKQNSINLRIEAYSKEINTVLYFTQKYNKETEILIITAFRKE